MFHSLRNLGLLMLLSGLLLCPAYGEKEQKAKAEVKSCTAEKKTGEVKAKVKSDKDSKSASDNKTNSENSNVNEVGDIEINNYGIQAIFINSDVTISGGTISGEMTKNENGSASQSAKPAVKKPTANGAAKPKPGKKPEKPGKFAKLIKDATKEAGLFTVYTGKDNKIYWEVKPEQTEKNLMASGTLATGLGSGWVKPGTYMGGLVVQFRKIDNKLQLIQKNTRFTAPGDSQKEAAIAKNYSDSIIASFPIDVTNPENSAYVVEMGKFLLTDFFNMGRDVNSSLGGAYGFDRSNSYVKKTKVFPENIVVRTSYAFRSGGMGGTIAVPHPGSLQLELLLDIRELKDNPDFKPRVADTRIGHFLEAHIDFSDNERATRFVRYISKWDVRKASPELEMSPPVKPIVVWIENTVPKKYRGAIRDGLLEWNKAFEKIGVKGALVVKEQPDDASWDVSDSRYNTIHWNESHSMAYGGVAQWVADPRTGEILHGSFLVEAENLRGLLNLRRVREPDRIAMLKERLTGAAPVNARRMMTDYQSAKADQAAFGMTIMSARAGIDNISEEVKDDFVNQYLFSLICNEWGHVLGFRHNFEASTLHPLEDLHNKALTKETGLTSSIMEYLPINIAPEGVEQGYYFEPTIGPYDYLAVEYAYREINPATGETEASILNAIAEKAETPKYTYGTDEDAYGRSLDPLCNTFDLGNDPLAFGKQTTQLVQDTIPKLPNLVKDGDTYLMVRIAYNRLLSYYFDSTSFALKYIGGQYVNRVKKGGANDPAPLEPVSAARQREAVNFIVETIFSDKIFDVDPEMLNMMAAEKWYHWGSSPFGSSSEYSLSSMVENMYDVILYSAYSPLIMRRLIDAEKQLNEGQIAFTVPELFRRLKQGIWNEVYDSVNLDSQGKINIELDKTYSNKHPMISTYRRTLQRLHLKRMIEITLQAPYGMPDDARTQAWRTLVDLDKNLSTMVKAIEGMDSIDDYSRDHLAESLVKIKRALNANISARIDRW
jgi:uncharacterized protein DUF4953/uncharacterized protein DUF5117/uncharacterized protein DUF5118